MKEKTLWAMVTENVRRKKKSKTNVKDIEQEASGVASPLQYFVIAFNECLYF